MAEAVEWKDKDVITAEKLNQMQQVQGPKGDKGDTGATGKQGPAGKQGPKGDPGTNGKDGAKGADGLSVKAGVINLDKNGTVTGGTITMSDDSKVNMTVNKATS